MIDTPDAGSIPDARQTTPYRPSNGTEGMIFMDQWCARCMRDASMRDGSGSGCRIAADTMAYDVDDAEYPKEWIEDDVEYPVDSNPRCTAFELMWEPDDSPIPDARQMPMPWSGQHSAADDGRRGDDA